MWELLFIEFLSSLLICKGLGLTSKLKRKGRRIHPDFTGVAYISSPLTLLGCRGHTKTSQVLVSEEYISPSWSFKRAILILALVEALNIQSTECIC